MSTVFLLLFVVQAGSGVGLKTDPTPTEILTQFRNAYAQARSYQDEGAVTIQNFTRKQLQRTKKLQFSTRFERGGSFRLAYAPATPTTPGECSVIWSDGTHSRFWASQRAITDSSRTLAQSLLLAGAGSGSVSRRIPALVFPDEKKGVGWVNELRSLRLLGSETINGHACYHLSALGGQRTLPTQVQLWLDITTGLLIRLEERSAIAEFEAVTTLDYEPRLNPELSPSALAFGYQNCLK